MRPSLAQGGGKEERVACELPVDLYLPSLYPEQLLATLKMCCSSLPNHIHLSQSLIQMHYALLMVQALNLTEVCCFSLNFNAEFVQNYENKTKIDFRAFLIQSFSIS